VHLVRQKNNAGAGSWWKCFGVLKEQDDVKLKCLDQLCGAKMSATNPSARAKTHFILQDGRHVCRKRAMHSTPWKLNLTA